MDEFIERKQSKQSENNSKSKLKDIPMLASACPGWICYAEKTQGWRIRKKFQILKYFNFVVVVGEYILPFISKTKSPQQIMGTLVKQHLAKQLNKQPNEIYHVSVMPCFGMFI